MNTDRLEEFVKANREEFDHLEPSPAVWEKIQGKQKKTKTEKLRTIMFRVAAVVAIGIISSAILVHQGYLSGGKMAAINDPEVRGLLETEAFYAHQVSGKMNEIRKCYSTFPEIKAEIENDLIELESMYRDLKTDLKDNVSNKMVIEAMIENNRYRLKLVDSVLEQINC